MRRISTPSGHVIEYEFHDWMADASCRAETPAWFFPEAGSRGKIEIGHLRGLAVCYGCPVRMQCFDHSIEHREFWGTWGGALQEWRRPVLKAIRDYPDMAPDLADQLRYNAFNRARRLGVFSHTEEEQSA